MDINQTIQQIDWHREPYGLYEPIEYTLASGGKRLRPTLALLGSQVFGGKDEEVMPAALALEVFHNFTLLHDDVMDHSPIRRGRATVHVRWGENAAILSGDQMLIEAYRLLSGVSEQHLPAVLRLFNDMATGICEGQQYDMEFERRENVSVDEYMRMIRLKTSVLLAYALKIGATLAGADEEAQNALFEYGILIGLAFQLQDDWLDCYGNPATFGKPIGGDIREGKKTWMMLTALQQASLTDRQELLSRDYQRVMTIYDRMNISEQAQDYIHNLTTQALGLLDQLPQNEATEQLRGLGTGLLNRKV